MEDKEKKFPELLQKETTRRGFLRGSAVAAGSAVALATIGSLAPKSAQAQAQAKPPEPKKDPMKFLFAERQNCTGCRACE
ncbi:MAG: twin-arginine translocation signal domain-containing protein, partial [Deltaproteobacteria bacterium]|nr:twin-arginine translocation signal domain-containing protein [Deltaproteobacteria bacterium]